MNFRSWFRSSGSLVSTLLLASFGFALSAAPIQAQTAVGSTSATQTATVTITTAGTLSNIAVLTQGATGLDFQAAAAVAGDCTTGTAYNVGDTCTVQYTFSPTHPWVRYGGISLSDSSGNLLGNVYLKGMGTGPQVSYPPSATTVPTTLIGGTNSFPNSVAIDGNGNLYFADAGINSVKKIAAVAGVIPANPTVSTVAAGFNSPLGVAVDGSGNLFVLDSGSGTVKEIVAVGGVIPPSPTPVTVASGFSAPQGIAVDGSGNIYVADSGNTALKEVVAQNGVIPASPTITPLDSAASVTAVTVDGAGNVFYTSGTTQVKELVGGAGAPVAVATLPSVNSLAIDGSGDLYAGDTVNKAVYELVAVSGVIPANPTPLTLGTGFVGPKGVAVDGSGNVYVADFAGSAGAVKEINVQTPPTITFTSTAANTISSDSPMFLTIGNNGTDPLVFTTQVPSAGFVLNGASTCPASSVAAGAICTDSISFDPTSLGPVTGNLTSTDNNLNVAAATQVVPLAGGVASPTIAVTSPSAAVDTTTVPLSATITFNGVAPSGAFSFTVNGSSTGVSGPTCNPVTSTTTTCTATLDASAAGLAVGTYPIVASLAADTSNNPATGNGTLTITAATPGLTVGTSNASVAVNTPITFTANVTPTSGVTPSGTVSFTSTLGAGSPVAIAGCTAVTVTAGAATCTTSALAAGSYTITANLAADTNFTAQSATVAQTVTAATPGLTVGTSNASVPVNTSLTFTAHVTPTSGITPTGTVSFTSTLGAGSPVAIAGCTAVTVTAGAATCVTSALTAGSYTITANLTADSNFTAQSATVGQTITQATPGLSVGTSNASVPVNTALTFTANVTPTTGITPSGTVSFTSTLGAGSPVAIAGCTNVTPTAGVATCVTSALTAGSYTITANLAADTNFTAKSATVAQTVTKVTPTVVLNTTNATPTVNGSVTLTATVTPNSGIIPTGTVAFTTTLSGNTTTISGCGAVSVVSGVATCTTTLLNAGSNSIGASIASDTNFNTGTATAITETVAKATPVVVLTGSGTGTSPLNGSVTFTATVTPNSGVIPSGKVSFTTTLNGTTTPIAGCTNVSLTPGTPLTATCTTTALNAGSNSIGASIATDNNFNTASATAIPETVNTGTPVVVLTTSGASSTVDGAVTFTATVTPNAGIVPTGTVSFTTTLSGTTTPIAGCSAVPLVTGASITATCVTSGLLAGSNTISSSITSDPNYVTATSNNVTQTVALANTTLAVTSSGSPSTVNQAVTFTATLSATQSFTVTPTGTVSFTSNGTLIAGCGTVTLSATTHTATCTTSSLQVPSDVIIATYTGDTNFNPSTSPQLTQIVTKNTPVNTVTSSLPTTAVVNQAVTFTATITPGGASSTGIAPTGSVTFTKGGVNVCSPAVVTPNSNGTGTASCSTPFLTAFTATNIVATYSGDSNFTAGNAPTVAQTVLVAPTTTTATSPVNPSTVNQSVTLSATFAPTNTGAAFPGTATPQTGTVSFSDTLDVAGSPFCTTTIAAGTPNPVSCPHIFTTAGNHVITATYSGDANFAGSTSANLTQQVNASGTEGIQVGTTTPTLTVDQNGTFTAVFTPTVTGTQPTGTVSYFDSALVGAGNPTGAITACGSLAVTGAGTIPNCTETMLVAGTHNIKAVFTTGDTNFQNITSPIFAQVVAQNTTAVTLNSPTTPAVTDQTLTFAATVTPGTLTPTGPGTTVPSGNVVFTYVLNSTTTTICTAAVSTTANVTSATCNAAFTTAGSYAVTATYSGDANFQTAASTPNPQAVNKAATSVGLSGATLSSPASPAVNQPATYSVQISAVAPANTTTGGASVPTGSVIFTDTTTSATCTAVVQPSGVASCSFSDPASGTHTVTAVYSGDANFSGNTQSFSQSIGLSGTSVTNVTVTPGSPAVNQTTSLNATVTANNSGTIPTGTVVFSDAFTGSPTTTCTSQITAGVVAACSHLFTTAGAHTLTATYSGDANFGTSFSSITVTVGAAGTVTINVATTTPSPIVNQTATFTATFAGLPSGGAQPQGTVSYFDSLAGAGAISTCTNLTVTAGVIPNCTETMVVAGTHNITAVFTTGDTNFQNITSPLFPEIVAQNTTSVTITSPTGSSVVDQVLTFSATVTPGTLTPAGVGSTVPGGGVSFTYVLGGVTTTICTAPVSTTAGVTTATCSAALTAAGSYSITATYAGDTNFKTSASAPHSEVVGKEGTSLALVGGVLSSPASPAVNQQATYSIQVLLAGGISDTGLAVPTGNVTFTDAVSGATCSGVVQAATSQASCQFSEPTSGSHTINVTYNGDGNFSISTASFPVTIGLSGTSVTNVTATPANPAVNQSTALNATVTATNPLGTVPTGSVTFTDTLAGSTSTCVSQITGGVVAACTHLFTAAGNHTVTAAYSGDSNFSASSSSITVTVGAAGATTIQVATTTPTPIVNQNATFTAAFVGLPPGGAQPQGTVSYYDSLLGSSPISTCTSLTVTAGVIPNCVETMLVAGTHNITAAFTSGNNNFQNISSSLFPEVVSQNSTSVTVNSPNGTSVVDQVLTFTATVTPAVLTPAGAGSTVPTGSVAFTYVLNGNTTPICSPQVSTTAGVTTATCSAALTVAGSYAVTATYSGDTNFITSASAPHAETVSKEATSLALISGSTLTSPPSPAVGQSGTYSVQLLLANGITDTGLTLPTGNVVFTDAANPSATCTAVIQGTTAQAACQFPEGTSGVHTINVTYAGDSNFSGSTASFTVTLAAGAPIVGLTSSSASNTSTATQTVIFTATAIAPPNGTVPSNPAANNFVFSITQGASSLPCDSGSYSQGVNGTTDVATCKVTFPSSVFGAFAVAVTYNGDANYSSASANLTQTVLNFVPTIVVKAGTPAVTITPAHVTLAQGSTVIANTTLADAFRGPETVTYTVAWLPSTPTDATAVTACILVPVVSGLTCAPTTDGTGVVFTATVGAAVGDYTAQLTVTDLKTPTLSQNAQVPVTVVAQPAAVFTAAVGTTTATFTLPPSLAAAASTLQCNSGLVKTSASNGTYVTGSSSTFAQIGIACSAITSTTASGVTTYSFVITAGQPGTAKLETGNSTVIAATLGAPFLLLFGLLPAFRKQRKSLLRGLGVLLMGIAIIQTTGCGGGGFTHITPPQAVTGSYLIGIVNSAGVTVAEVPLVIGNN